MPDPTHPLEQRVQQLDETTVAVRDFIDASQDLTGRMARRMRTNVSDMTAILYLANRGPIGAAALAEHLGMSRPATTALVDRLERQGMLERVRDPDDRRRVVISSTPAARTAALGAWLPAIEELDAVCRSLSPEDGARARDLLRQLTGAMSRGGRS